jgi:organic hydroperoxide reductase OsmC/OhrA
VSTRPKVLLFDVSVDRDRIATSGLGGSPIPSDNAWRAEHLVLAGLVRCTLTSMDYAAHRAGLEVAGSGSARGTVTKRDEDGLHAFVEVEVDLEVELDPLPSPAEVEELVAKAEHGCFVGNSLTARPRYRWTVNRMRYGAPAG